MTDLTPEQEEKLAEYFARITDFMLGDNKNCPLCGKPIGGIHLYAKIEPGVFSLYILPCNHRLGLWGGAPEWVIKDGLPVEVIESEY